MVRQISDDEITTADDSDSAVVDLTASATITQVKLTGCRDRRSPATNRCGRRTGIA
jgi:hypothetical protein